MFDIARGKKHIAPAVRMATGTGSQVRAWGKYS
jgi:hypothetical protein